MTLQYLYICSVLSPYVGWCLRSPGILLLLFSVTMNLFKDHKSIFISNNITVVSKPTKGIKLLLAKVTFQDNYSNQIKV